MINEVGVASVHVSPKEGGMVLVHVYLSEGAWPLLIAVVSFLVEEVWLLCLYVIYVKTWLL